ncbi:translation elongation factor Ts [Candidatus Palibaumannia cicadellinicola]|uniref:Elongation factor Ts n=1 Tax=Baumannia cicadellinicola subsp. Homalodisca coagulata TaxID=374463 RepID=EFTS_BAUCH|nr:translation elongation factor Ts [Candidatus Baumannia cicadellinicola]Q1LSV6.1 RecName: Full=Elongation factor Ts; Short=EF-Ts [Baumannia cicadellinicola str. Hc (Homalodisca coagulata)]ABF14348.1 translation elongation factor Ts [Baumannia cicadellinicola str. Hc (Homalodisca coagulata)]MCJ7462180.1 translation elongation factor Ts [Candidatus Baumannia cicadellinicola]MCJ7462798.1 translation elongation factor Ts [Candidatus Baumannia cicadellinicola]
MVAITTTLVKQLRDRTNAGLMKCKKALIEANGDIELAIDNLRKSGQITAANKSSRITAQGIILTKINHNSQYGVIIELNCETDFVAKDKIFKNFGEDIITTALNQKISSLEEIKSLFEEKRITLVDTVGENINIRRINTLEGNLIVSYLHDTRIGVLLSANNISQNLYLGKQIAMHIAAMKPKYIQVNDIPSYIISREHKIQLNIAMQSNKPQKVIQQIVEGRMREFTRDISLLDQNFIIDPSQKVGQILEHYNIIVKNFIRFEVGEWIEQEEHYKANES